MFITKSRLFLLSIDRFISIEYVKRDEQIIESSIKISNYVPEIINMKKKRTILSIVVTIAVVEIGAFFALKPSPANINQVELDTQANATGKKCNYTLGCS